MEIYNPYYIPGLKRHYLPLSINHTPKEIAMADVVDTICRHFMVELEYFEGITTNREVIRRRNIVWYFLRTKVNRVTYTELGTYFKGHEYGHCNVILALRTIKEDEEIGIIKQRYF